MVGYALITLYAALHKRLDPESSALLKGAVLFLIVYGWLVHLEPFVREWRLRGGIGACGLYSGVAGAMGLLGGLLAEVALDHSLPGDTLKLLSWMAALFGVGWISYRLMLSAERDLDRFVDWLYTRIRPAAAASEATAGARGDADPAATRTQARSTRA